MSQHRCIAMNESTAVNALLWHWCVAVEENELFDFRGLRMDWYRLQVRIRQTHTHTHRHTLCGLAVDYSCVWSRTFAVMAGMTRRYLSLCCCCCCCCCCWWCLSVLSCYMIVLQAYTSVSKGGLNLMDHRELAKHINTLVYHSRMVDSLDEMLNDTSDLSIYWSVCLSSCNYILYTL